MRCHQLRGFGQYPGYHVYVKRDGTMYYCRPVSMIGCHVKGFNAHSIGVCYEGGLDEQGKPKDTRTEAQKEVLHEVFSLLKECYPTARIVGHHELYPGKACPCLTPPASKQYAYLSQ